MASHRRPLSLVAVVMTILAASVTAQLIPMDFCASINTASGPGNSSIYQSDGLCRDFCSSSYAFSVIKNSECWCTDVQPGGSVSVSITECNSECPGFPDDTCGGPGGLYGYIQHEKSPTSTQGSGGSGGGGSGGSSSTTTSSPSNTNDSEPTKPLVTPSQSVSTMTRDGITSLQTITVFPTVTANPDTNTSEPMDDHSSDDGGLSTGAAVGIAIGVVAVVLGIGGVLFFLWYRRRKQNEQQSILERSNSARGSSAGMTGTPRTEMASIWDNEQSSQRRNSRFMPNDPRMDPFAGNIYGRLENKSRESVGSLEDNQDYSRRVLRTTNPDPDA